MKQRSNCSFAAMLSWFSAFVLVFSKTFTTPADPAPPAPVLAKNVDAKPVSGKVFLLVGGKLVPLTEAD